MITIIRDGAREQKDIIRFEGLYVPSPTGIINHYGGVDHPKQILTIYRTEDKTCSANGIVRVIHVVVTDKSN